MKKLLPIVLCLILVNCVSDDDSGCNSVASFGEFKSSNIGYTSVRLDGGILIEDCAPTIVEKGIVYGKESSPTILDSKKLIHTTLYNVSMTALEMNTKYYFREFVTTSKNTIYGTQIEVMTLLKETVSDCTAPIYLEKDGKIVVEFESAAHKNGWDIETSATGYSGDGYLVWNGAQYFGDPTHGVVAYKLRITTTGTYKFLWNSRVTHGNNGTEHNDTWLSFPDVPVGNFYGKKGTISVVYPGGLGLSPVPKGSSKLGYFKIYKSGAANEWKWQATTSDNDGHSVYLDIDTPGDYTMKIAVRSSYHAIDKFVLFKTNVSAPTTELDVLSEILCLD